MLPAMQIIRDGVLAPVWSADMREVVSHSLPVPGFSDETSAMEREQKARGTSVPGKSSGNGVFVGRTRPMDLTRLVILLDQASRIAKGGTTLVKEAVDYCSRRRRPNALS